MSVRLEASSAESMPFLRASVINFRMAESERLRWRVPGFDRGSVLQEQARGERPAGGQAADIERSHCRNVQLLILPG